MADNIPGEKRQLLTGKSNYLGWSKIIKSTLATRKLVIKNEVQVGKADEAVGTIMQHLSLNIAGDEPDEEGPMTHCPPRLCLIRKDPLSSSIA